jgi:hypothetical protein
MITDDRDVTADRLFLSIETQDGAVESAPQIDRPLAIRRPTGPQHRPPPSITASKPPAAIRTLARCWQRRTVEPVAPPVAEDAVANCDAIQEPDIEEFLCAE